MTSRLEKLKDVVQVAVESGAGRVGRIAGVITAAVGEIAREVGEWAGDVFEVIEAARQAPEPIPASKRAQKESRQRR